MVYAIHATGLVDAQTDQHLFVPNFLQGLKAIPADKSVAVTVEVPRITTPENRAFCESAEEAEHALPVAMLLINTVQQTKITE